MEEYRVGKERIMKIESELESRIKSIEAWERHEHAQIKDSGNYKIKGVCDILTDQSLSSEVKGKALRSVVKKIVYDKKSGEMKFIYYMHLQ